MTRTSLRRWIPEAQAALVGLLDNTRGAVEPPIRSEIFGLQRMATHGRSLAETHCAAKATWRTPGFAPRLRSNIRMLREAHAYVGLQAATGYEVSPAAEWLLDNFHLIEAQLETISEALPWRYFRSLPVLVDEPLAGLPRIYGVAWAFVAHTDGAFDDALLTHFLGAYQEARELRLSEMWALPTVLRVVLIENLRRLAERVATNTAAREVANLCSDRLDAYSVRSLGELLAFMNRRGVGRVFLAQMAQRLEAFRGEAFDAHHRWLREALPDLDRLRVQQAADQAADNLSVSNAVNSLRAISDADWPDIVARASVVMRLMLTSPGFAAEHQITRDRTLHGIELLATRSGRPELAVAQALLDLVSVGRADDPSSTSEHFWLQGAGRAELWQAAGLPVRAAHRCKDVAGGLRLPVYLGTLWLGTLLLMAWVLMRHGAWGAAGMSAGWAWAGVILMALPASEAVLAVVNRLISESARPAHVPRLALAGGIPPEHRTIVVIPALLSDTLAARTLAHRLQLHYLANPEPNVQFALLTDWSDAATERDDGDDDVLAAASQEILALNARHPGSPGGAARFILLHRSRRFSPTEQCWIGWERKRGKLEELVAALAEGTSASFANLGAVSRIAAHTRYIVTLDSDTHLPVGRLRDLVAVAAHPDNEPRLDAAGGIVVSGYGILQPRIVTPLPSPRDITPYHWLFAGQCGVDPYSAATSEVYQDLFGEGSFTGKGLLNVKAMHAVLRGRLPEGLVLSHDLLEGSLARCATVTDITLIEDAPFHAEVAASRQHRWMRGDWQLLPFLLEPTRYRLRAINRWKMFDNLRRSLVAPASLAFLVLALAGFTVSPWAALLLVIAAFSAGPLMGALAAFVPSRRDLAGGHFLRRASIELARALGGGLWHLAQLLQEAMTAADATLRAAYRMTVSHRHLLQWTTAAAAQARTSSGLGAALRQHCGTSWLALALLAGVLAAGTPHGVLASLLCLLWAGSPVWTWWVSRAPRSGARASLKDDEQFLLECTARDSWRLFERCVEVDDHHLPPDNLQTLPHDAVAHRTSPTNIGLYLLSAACAREFGWIGTQDLLERLEATLATLATMQRHRGHLLNWYDTQTLAPLLPSYVSTVDSGNLSGHLLAVGQACLERARAPYGDCVGARAIARSTRRLSLLLARLPHPLPAQPDCARLALLVATRCPPMDDRAAWASYQCLMDEVVIQWAQVAAGAVDPGAATRPTRHEELAWCVADHAAAVRSAGRDAAACVADNASGVPAAHTASRRLRAVAQACERMAWEPDFRFLYHRKRHLFHIGYRVAEQELDTGFYDLLASEARLTSLLAIAKGDVPAAHWAALGRPFFAAGALAGLRSWSGSMFEYLMPTLVLDEPQGSVLRDACRAALREQIDFARAHGVPWGISESAYAGRDHTLAYQYSPQGVPRLALRRTPPHELVVAPYATALAAQIAPDAAAVNMVALKAFASYARYGFIEALDFSPARQTGRDACTPVVTFMAHHQGMSIVALANVLLDGAAQRWGMGNPSIEAAASLLHEQPPREVGRLRGPPIGPPPGLRRRAPGLLRELVPGATALDPTHLLSNGRYSVALRSSGAGWSRWGSLDITRWRDDALRDGWGSFLYLRGESLPRMVSLTLHPAPDPAARYACTYHADRVCFDTVWPGLQARTTIWVSPEDDIEFRQVELHNLGDEPIELELLSAFEVALSDTRADEAHPAFMNLFVRARWDDAQQAIVWQRVPRLATERGLQATHFLAESDPQVVGMRLQTDRQRWRGRQQPGDRLVAALDDLPDPTGTGDLDTGLDPVSVLAVRLRIAPNAKAQLTFAMAASDDPALLRAIVDKYRQATHVQRASLMSATLTGIRFRMQGIDSETLIAVQALTTALVLSVTRPPPERSRLEDAAMDASDRRLLWRFGISGDRPLILVTAGVLQGLGLLRSLAQALRLWSWAGVACDLVVVNAEPASYDMGLQREIAALRERHDAEARAQSRASVTALNLLRADELTREELATLHGLARIRLQADGRPLSHHVAAWSKLHEAARRERGATEVVAVGAAAAASSAGSAPTGAFVSGGREFTFDVVAGSHPARPWINVLANREFGAHLSEAGGGYTWAGNSRLNQLTAWSNDPVADPPSEWFLIQDHRTQQAWTVAPGAWGDGSVSYRVSHGQGYSVIRHRRGHLEVTATWCVDPDVSVKQVRLQLINHGAKTLQLRLTGIAEWMMGAYRTDRTTVTTAHARQPIGVPDPGESSQLSRAGFVTVLLCSQRERSAGFGDGTAFLAAVTQAGELQDWTCDRRECFDAEGRLVLPDQWGQRSGPGLDPCAALSIDLVLPGAERTERVFLLGHAKSAGAALQLAAEAAALPGATRYDEVRGRWDELLGATTVKTPDPLFDAMVNRWLLYQTVACRLWAKAGFYQAGGATGFRDQLQDAMALAWAAPAMLGEQILLAASRQFVEGDVQHWWHSPGGAGVRTRFSDDLLWLPHACVHYLRATGDSSLLDRRVSFLEGPLLPHGAEDAYDVPAVSSEDASVYEHAARTIDRSLATGAHGLPLMGTGDWNDGMNRVGHEGRGESVWLGWFLCRVVADFAPLARERGDAIRAGRWESAAQGWRRALEGPAWDGEWFVRAFFDDGQPLGAQANPEARIDLIAQAWAVLSRAASDDHQRIAMASAHSRLVDAEAGLIRLLDPPLAHATPNAGYIQAYPPGVRENGGQYSHAGVWALMAQAELAAHADAPPDARDQAYRYFTYLSPAHRASDPRRGAVYGIEPYAMAGDVYSQPPYVGRGGWSWYTGAAAWMHRAAVESIFGLTQTSRELFLRPCLPTHWPRAELTLQRDGRSMRFILIRMDEVSALAATAADGARLLQHGCPVAWTELPSHTCFVIPIR